MIRARTHLRYSGYSAVCGQRAGRKRRGILGVDCPGCVHTATFDRLLEYQRNPGLRADVAVALDWLVDHPNSPIPSSAPATWSYLFKMRAGVAAEQVALLAIEADTAQYGQEWIMSTFPGERQRGECVVGLLDAMVRLMVRRRLESREATWLSLGSAP